MSDHIIRAESVFSCFPPFYDLERNSVQKSTFFFPFDGHAKTTLTKQSASRSDGNVKSRPASYFDLCEI